MTSTLFPRQPPLSPPSKAHTSGAPTILTVSFPLKATKSGRLFTLSSLGRERRVRVFYVCRCRYRLVLRKLLSVPSQLSVCTYCKKKNCVVNETRPPPPESAPQSQSEWAYWPTIGQSLFPSARDKGRRHNSRDGDNWVMGHSFGPIIFPFAKNRGTLRRSKMR